MSGQANCVEWLLWALLIITGSYDKPGGMWFNPGYLRQLDQRDWTPATGKAEPGPSSRPELPRRIGEYPTAALLDEIDAGNVRALLVMGGSPLSAFPEAERTEKMLRRLEVLAVADVLATPTTRIATHVLPTTGQLERADLPGFIDQFHPIVATRYTAAVVPPGAQRKPLWWVTARLAARLGHDILPPGVDLDATDDDLLAGVAARSRVGSLQAIQEGGIDNVADEPVVFGWVLPRLPGGRWRLAPGELIDQLASLTAHSGPVLIPHRNPHNLNSQLADQRADESGRIELSPADAAQREIADGATVSLRSQSGTLVGPARIVSSLPSGVVSVPHGFAEVNVGQLTSASSSVDPLTGMVTLSTVPVEIATAPPAEESHGTG